MTGVQTCALPIFQTLNLGGFLFVLFYFVLFFSNRSHIGFDRSYHVSKLGPKAVDICSEYGVEFDIQYNAEKGKKFVKSEGNGTPKKFLKKPTDGKFKRKFTPGEGNEEGGEEGRKYLCSVLSYIVSVNHLPVWCQIGRASCRERVSSPV